MKERNLCRNFISFIIFCTWTSSENGAHGLVTVISRSTNQVVAKMKSQTAIVGIDKTYKIKGGLVNAVPSDSCESLDSSIKPVINETTDSEYDDTWVLLASVNNCDFDTKVTHAQNAGYSAIIIYNDDNTTTTMPVSEDNVDNYYIFVCFVSSYDGLLLKNNYSFDNGFSVQLSSDPSFQFNWWLLLVMALCVAICVMVFVLCFRLAWYFTVVIWERITGLREDFRRFARERRRSKRNKLFAAALKNVPSQKYNSAQLSDGCAICTEEFFEEEDDLRILSCNHGFHVSCIDEWLVNGRRDCPVCKRKVILENHHEIFSNTDSDTDDETAPLLSTSHNQYGNIPTSQQRVNPFNLRGNIQQTRDDHEIV